MLKRSSLLAIGFATLAAAWWPTPGVADTFTTIAGSSDYEGHPAIAFDFGGFDSSKDFAKYLPRYMIAYEYFTTSGPGAGYTTINSRYVDIDCNLGPINLVSPAYGFYSHPTLAFKWGTYGQQNLVYLAAWQDAH